MSDDFPILYGADNWYNALTGEPLTNEEILAIMNSPKVEGDATLNGESPDPKPDTQD